MRIEPGQVAVVTGAASGIGFALSKAFASQGLRVAMADVEPDALASAAKTVGAQSKEIIARHCNVADPDAVDALRDAVLSAFGRVDIICNNAGVVIPFRPIWEVSRAECDWILDVNLRGVINGIRAFVPMLVAQSSGHVVNTASLAGVVVVPRNAAYNATKHAVVSLTETLQAEFDQAGLDIGATAICCGLVRTRIREAARNRPDGKGETVIGSLEGALEPDEVAAKTLAAIAGKQLYLFTNAGSDISVNARLSRLRADLALGA